MKIKIIKKKDGSFAGDTGERVAYWWYTGMVGDLRREFGSTDGSHNVGDEPDLNLYGQEKAGGKIVWKEDTSEQ